MVRRRIQPGWRFSLAQGFLRLLFGWPKFTITPWKKSGIAVCIIVVRNNRVLLAQRAGRVEHAGCWSAIGGYVELESNESFAQGAVREFFEETHLQLPVAQFPLSPDATYISYDQPKHSEASATSTVGYYFTQTQEDILPHLAPTEETATFQWFTENEVRSMISSGKIPPDFTDLHQAMQEIFTRLKAETPIRPLKLSA